MNIIDLEKFLTKGQAKKIDEKLAKLETDTGYKLRVSHMLSAEMHITSGSAGNNPELCCLLECAAIRICLCVWVRFLCVCMLLCAMYCFSLQIYSSECLLHLCVLFGCLCA